MRHPIYEAALLDFLAAMDEDMDATIDAMRSLGVTVAQAAAGMEAFAEAARNIDWDAVRAWEAAHA